jgi:hypothetical protein
MVKSYLIAILIVFIFHQGVQAQQTGTLNLRLVDDKTDQPIELATISVIRLSDLTPIKHTVANRDGIVHLNGLPFNNYKIVISQINYEKISRTFSISVAHKYIDLGIVKMKRTTRLLQDVIISKEKVPIVINGDTTEHNARSYKTQINDNVEDLLKKIPGVNIDRQGNITTQGKQVNKITVDGNDFFGNDPKAATKNLSADAIDKIQIIDSKTESAKNTGIDDGQREKVINLTLKKDYKKAWFGNIQAESGTTDRYLGQLNLNRFEDKRQISILLLSNNVNESGFSLEDLNNFTGNNIFGAFSSTDGGSSLSIDRNGRANVNNAFSGVQDGLIKYNSAGLNFSQLFGKKNKIKLSFNVVSIISSNYLSQVTDIEDAINDLYTHQNAISRNSYDSYRLNLNLTYKRDSLNTFILKPLISLGYKSTNSSTSSTTTNLNVDSINKISQIFDQSSHNPLYGAQLTLNHLFPRSKGSLNFNAIGNYTTGNQSYINDYVAKYYVNGVQSSITNETSAQENNSTFFSGTVSLIRQINKKQKLNFTLSQKYDYRKDNGNQYSLDYNGVTGRYDIYDPSLSGNVVDENVRYTSTAGLNRIGQLYTWNINLAIADLGLTGTYLESNQHGAISNNALVFLPNASVSYHKKNAPGYSLSFNSVAQLPQAIDLQPVVNNTNPLYIRQGNPNLIMSRSYNFSYNYSSFNATTNTSFSLFANYSIIVNGFSSQSVVNNDGITTITPINTNGNLNASFGGNWNRPSAIKGLKYKLGSYIAYNRFVNYVNNSQNAVLRFMPQINGGIDYDSEKIQASVNGFFNFNSASNSFQYEANQQYFNYDNLASISLKPTKKWRLFTTVNQRLFIGQPSSSNTAFYIWNAGIEHYLLPKQNFTISLNAFDILNENAGLRRMITSTGQIQNIQSNTIGRFLNIKIIYKILKFTPTTTVNK